MPLKCRLSPKIGNPPAIGAATEFDDFTAATEVDNGDMLTVTSDTITFAYVDNSDNYVYWDCGANYFDGDWEVQGEINIASGDDLLVMVAFFSNTLDDSRTADNAGDGQGIRVHPSGTDFTLNLSSFSDSVMSTSIPGLSLNTDYYFTFSRDDDDGTYGKLTLTIYSDSARTSVVATRTLSPNHGKWDYRYFFPFNGYNMSETDTASGTVSNFKMVSPALP